MPLLHTIAHPPDWVYMPPHWVYVQTFAWGIIPRVTDPWWVYGWGRGAGHVLSPSSSRMYAQHQRYYNCMHISRNVQAIQSFCGQNPTTPYLAWDDYIHRDPNGLDVGPPLGMYISHLVPHTQTHTISTPPIYIVSFPIIACVTLSPLWEVVQVSDLECRERKLHTTPHFVYILVWGPDEPLFFIFVA